MSIFSHFDIAWCGTMGNFEMPRENLGNQIRKNCYRNESRIDIFYYLRKINLDWYLYSSSSLYFFNWNIITTMVLWCIVYSRHSNRNLWYSSVILTWNLNSRLKERIPWRDCYFLKIVNLNLSFKWQDLIVQFLLINLIFSDTSYFY